MTVYIHVHCTHMQEARYRACSMGRDITFLSGIFDSKSRLCKRMRNTSSVFVACSEYIYIYITQHAGTAYKGIAMVYPHSFFNIKLIMISRCSIQKSDVF